MRLAGYNYNISLRQVLECEKKIEDNICVQRITNFYKHCKAHNSIFPPKNTATELEMMPHYIMVVTSEKGDVNPIAI